MQTKLISAAIAAIGLLGLSPGASAATFCVTTPAEFQAALTTAASNGEDDVIRVHQGNYALTQQLLFDSSQTNGLDISGGWFSFPTPCAVQFPDASTTVLDGQGATGGLNIVSREVVPGTYRVGNLTIRRTRNTGLGETSGLEVSFLSTLSPGTVDLYNLILRENGQPPGPLINSVGIATFGPMNLRVRSTLVADNFGPGIVGVHAQGVTSGSVYLQHLTVAGNQGTGNGFAGVVKAGAANLTVENSIVWGNTSANAQGNCPLAVTNADRLRFVIATSVCGQQSGSNIGVQFVNPRFIDNDFRIGSNSPAFDIGMNPPTMPLTTRDIENNPRVLGNKPDLGAYESTGLFANGFE